jgi:uncharacterized protein YndB with AHSA1/START domain
MDLRADVRIRFPRQTVFAAYRDDMPQLLRYLPNVQSIEVKSRKEDGSRVEVVNAWRGGGDIPSAVRAVLSDSMLTWTDYATWDAASYRCEWRTETHALTDAVRCSGCNVFLDDGPSSTLLEIRGGIDVDAKKIRGVPGFFAGKVGRGIEEFLVGRIQANLVETTRGLETYLAERPA